MGILNLISSLFSNNNNNPPTHIRSRLTQSNEQYTTLLNQVQSQHSLSTSTVIPLKLEITRLKQELDATTSHSNYVDSELASRNETISTLKNGHASEVRTLRGELDHVKLELAQRQRELSSSRMGMESTLSELEKIRCKLQEKEYAFAEEREVMQQDLNKERELVTLKEQRMLLAEDQRDSLMREVESLKVLAREAEEESMGKDAELQRRLAEGVESAVRKVREQEEERRLRLEERLAVAEEAKQKFEEDILNKNTPLRRRRRMITEGGEQMISLAITDGDVMEEEGGPLSLTDIYTRLAETEDDLRAEQHENKKLKILIERIHRDVASKTPIFHQKQMELESALDEMHDMKERLDYARREVMDIRADNQDLEVKNQQMERECQALRRENVDLATQVQRLLQRGSGGGNAAGFGGDDVVTFDSVQTLQQQNQNLLRDHHTMTDKIQTLENHITNNPEKIELDQLKEEVVTLREEREKQSKLVAGIVHQRDLYRALVAKNDAPLIESGAGEHQLAIADARAEQLPMIEAKNRELVEEVAKLRADVSCSKHEMEALEGRLARVDAHADELTTSNERLRGELTAANATVARMTIDVSHYTGKCERFEASLEAVKGERDSESRGRNQLEELNNKLQTHLEAARSELARKQQQFETVSVICFCLLVIAVHSE